MKVPPLAGSLAVVGAVWVTLRPDASPVMRPLVAVLPRDRLRGGSHVLETIHCDVSTSRGLCRDPRETADEPRPTCRAFCDGGNAADRTLRRPL